VVLTILRLMNCGDRIECLQCGHSRVADTSDPGECPRCRYLGWAYVEEFDETLRRRLRELPFRARRTGASVERARIDSAA
jgi:hypothetical protein